VHTVNSTATYQGCMNGCPSIESCKRPGPALHGRKPYGASRKVKRSVGPSARHVTACPCRGQHYLSCKQPNAFSCIYSLAGTNQGQLMMLRACHGRVSRLLTNHPRILLTARYRPAIEHARPRFLGPSHCKNTSQVV